MKAIIFDLDGTLVDSRESILASIAHGLKEIGLEHLEFDRQKAVQIDLRATVEITTKAQGIEVSEEDIQKFIKSYRLHHSADPESTMTVYAGVPQMLESLGCHFSLAIATTKHSEQAKHILGRLKMDHYFEHIQGTDTGLRYKPAPDILNVTMDALGLKGMPAAYIGDSAHDMTAAKAAGLRAIGVAYGFGGRLHLEESEPHHIVDTVDELERLLL